MTELLAPVGSQEALKAAIANGADAVYLGGKEFNARASAANFTLEELAEAVEWAHFYGVRVYLTLNTLLHEDELPQALDYAAQAARLGIDAVIIQDLGLFRALRRALPGLPIHASTQMSLFNSHGVNAAAEAGASRAILARELSFEELAATKKAGTIPLEVFVHGALCIAYSGQCLMSSFIGARSGNRGSCAQPCRLPYALTDEKGAIIPTEVGAHLLSPRDLYGYLHLPELHQLGLSSWKIEGRMKRPEYVAVVTGVYRRFLDALEKGAPLPDAQEELDRLLQVFNRDYSSGYWLGNLGADLMSYQRPNNRGVFLGRITECRDGQISIRLEKPLHIGDGLEVWVKVGGRRGFVVSRICHEGIEKAEAAAGETVTVDFPGGFARAGDRVFKTLDARLQAEAQNSWAQLPALPLKMEIQARLNEPLQISAWDEDGFQAVYVDEYIIAPAETSPASLQQAEAQLGRLGGSGYFLAELKGSIEPNVLLPKSVLNRCRRALVAELRKKRLQAAALPPVDERLFAQAAKKLFQPAAPGRGKQKSGLPGITVLAAHSDVLLAAAAAGVKELYLTGEEYAGAPPSLPFKELHQEVAALGGRLIPSLPKIFHESQTEYWLAQMAAWEKAGAKALLIPNLGALGLAQKGGWSGALYGDSGLNIFNRQGVLFLQEQGLSRICLSGELNLAQLQALKALPIEGELVVQGSIQLMLSEYCPLGALKGGRGENQPCSRPCEKQGPFGLQDKKGYLFPCRMDENCRLHLFNSRQLCLGEDLDKLKKTGLAYFRLDLRLNNPEEAAELSKLYLQLAAGAGLHGDEQAALLRLNPQGYTKGHLYRGV